MSPVDERFLFMAKMIGANWERTRLKEPMNGNYFSGWSYGCDGNYFSHHQIFADEVWAALFAVILACEAVPERNAIIAEALGDLCDERPEIENYFKSIAEKFT